MLKLLIIADDFTGALDTGVQLSQKGVRTKVTTELALTEQSIEGIEVLVVDTETRHKNPSEAAELVSALTKIAVELGTAYYYKKTDSALRGNIGAELEAVLYASNERKMAFLPAFPKMKRTTEEGIQYIDGVPVGESIFASDPFNPVQHSSVKEIIAEQSTLSVYQGFRMENQDEEKSIMVLDASDQQELSRSGRICMENQIRVFAGCAGFAEELPELLGLSFHSPEVSRLGKKLTVICGSVNPISIAQIQRAKMNGFSYQTLSAKQKLAEDFGDHECDHAYLSRLQNLLAKESFVVIDSNDENREETSIYAKSLGISVEAYRDRIAGNLGKLTAWLYQNAAVGTLMIIGGDTLQKCMTELNITELVPLYEIFPGVVVSEFTYQKEKHHIITKSGGFGDPDLLIQLRKQYIGDSEYEE